MTPMEAFQFLSPAAYKAIFPWLNRPLADYLAHLWQTAGTGQAWLSPDRATGDRTSGRELFFRQLAESMTDQGLASSTVDSVRRQLERVPVVQTADHTQLLLDPVTFANHVATMIGAESGGCEHIVVLASSRNTFKSRSGHGPGMLAAGPGVLNVLGLTNRERQNSVCAHRDPVRFAFTPLGAPDGELERIGMVLRQLIGPEVHSSAPVAFHRANQAIWEHFGFHRIAGLVQLDSTFSARLAARHIRRGRGEVYDLFFDPEVRDAFLTARRAIGQDPMLGGFLRHQTDLVWGAVKGQLRPLSLRTGVLRDANGHVAIQLAPQQVASGLELGLLVPDISVTFLIENILADLCTLGGPSQLVYVPLLRDLARSTLGATALVQGVLEVDQPPINRLSRCADENARWVAELAARTVAESMGTMSAFRYLVGMAAQI